MRPPKTQTSGATTLTNAEIMKQYDYHAEAKFKDLALMPRYMKMPATITIKKKLDDLVNELSLDANGKRRMYKALMPMMIPPAVKASVRGNAFNDHIRGVITRFLKLKKTTTTAVFESAHDAVHEKPDWILYTQDASTHAPKTIIGYNQLDLWNGGAQLNRASKYIMDDALHARLKKKNIYIMCIVVRKVVLGHNENKVSKLVKKGLATKRLMWPKGFKRYLDTLL